MAWVTLHDLLAPDKNLRGLIPLTAEGTVRVPDQLQTVPLDPEAKNEVLALIEGIRKKLPSEPCTLQQIIDANPKVADCIEWTFTPQGRLLHFTPGLIRTSDGGSVFLSIVEIDVLPWIKRQPEEHIERIAKIFNGRVPLSGDDSKAKFRLAVKQA